MATVAGFPYFEVQFTRDGGIHDEQEVDALVEHVTSHRPTDLVTISHGWNNDMDEARRTYGALLSSLRARLHAPDAPDLTARSMSVLAVLWPSKKFAEEELTAGGAASAVADEAMLHAQLDDLKRAFDGPTAHDHLERAKQLVPKLDASAEARREFADRVRGLLPRDDADDEDASAEFFDLPGEEVMSRLTAPTAIPAEDSAMTAGGGGAAVMSGTPSAPDAGVTGEGAFFGELFGDVKTAARNLLNFATYYQMKARARIVGSRGVNEVLRRVRGARLDIKLHLVGHSFGGRLVTAAVIGPSDRPPIVPSSLTLLQAAFSHYGFAKDYEPSKDGLFRMLVTDKMVTGPVLITHTKNDRAVGLAYPLASRIAGQVASALGDENDRFGGIGRNGAQKTPEAENGSLLAAGKPYGFAGGLHNLRADAFIRDHGDVTGREVAHAVISAIAAT